MTMTTQILPCPTSRCRFPRVHIFRLNNSALVTFAQAGGNPMPNVHSLQPIPNQTAANPWQVLHPATYTFQFLDLQKLFNCVAQRERDALYVQRETVRHALPHQQGEFLAADHQYEAAARQDLLNTLARNSAVHKCKVQMQIRQLEHEAGARFSQRQR